MLHKILVVLVSLFISLSVASKAFSQDSNPDDSAQWSQEDWAKKFDKLENFDRLKNPPLSMGDTGDRVRELQLTLNHLLGGRIIYLRHKIWVGPSLPEGDAKKSRHRFAYSKHREKAFQIRGDWKPVENANGDDLQKPDKSKYFRVNYLKLPEHPLKVDGIYGQQTKAAVALFQNHHHLNVTGEVDALTLDKLEPLIPTSSLLGFIMPKLTPLAKDYDHYPVLVKTITSILATLIILIAAAIIYQIARSISTSTRFLARWLFTPETSPWFSAFHHNKVFRKTALFAPAFFIYFAGQWVFPAPDDTADVFPYLNTFQSWNLIVSHFGLALVSLVLMVVGFAIANAVDSVSNPDQETENPIGSIIRASKRAIGFLGTLLIVASLAGESPFIIVGGLGAFMAIFILVFRDFLLGLVSSIQIIANKVVEIGDWISMPSYHADGAVQNISLTLIKVQNADKTISTIPTSAILSKSFQNWSGVEKSGVRRIKRSILIDMRRIKVCTPEMLDKLQKIELIQDYLTHKKAELNTYNDKHEVEASPVNSRRLTNIGTLRAYLDQYLENHPGLTADMPMLVRHLQPGSIGLPLEIYTFCNTTDWEKYESIQADIFDHLLAILPEFELRAFQEPAEFTMDAKSPDLSLMKAQAGVAELESLVEEMNRELRKKPRAQLSSRTQSVRKRIAELDLNGKIAVKGKGRQLILEHLEED